MPVCPNCGEDSGGASFCPLDGTPLSHVGKGRAAMPMEGDSVDGRYELRERLGKGGMAVVFRARSMALCQDVALKVLFPRWAENQNTVARFAREARAASQVDHENVVRVFDFGYAEEGFYYLTMELLQGQPLNEIELPLRPGRALRLLSQIAAGLGRAHELGVVHRDLKPENIMVSSEDGRETITIVDFGLSKIDEGNFLTGEGDVIGTPDFMAPEQWMGRGVDARADVYAFGIVAYELLAGELPFEGDNLVQMMQQHLYAIPLQLKERPEVPNLPQGLSELVMRCMAKDPLDRAPHMGRVHLELLRIDEATRELAAEPTRLGVNAAPMTTVVSAVEGVQLDRLQLLNELARLGRVRQVRLVGLLPRIFQSDPPGDVVRLQVDIEAKESALGAAEQDIALAEAGLKEAQRAHRTRETELRARLVEANLVLAVTRNALPGEITKAASRLEMDTIAIDGSSSPSWPPDEPAGDTEEEKARELLHRAEERLAAFVRAPDRAVIEAEGRFDEALLEKTRALGPLGQLYEQLEKTLRQAPSADPEAFAELAQLDGVLEAYRMRYELLERHAQRS